MLTLFTVLAFTAHPQSVPVKVEIPQELGASIGHHGGSIFAFRYDLDEPHCFDFSFVFDDDRTSQQGHSCMISNSEVLSFQIWPGPDNTATVTIDAEGCGMLFRDLKVGSQAIAVHAFPREFVFNQPIELLDVGPGDQQAGGFKVSVTLRSNPNSLQSTGGGHSGDSQ